MDTSSEDKKCPHCAGTGKDAPWTGRWCDYCAGTGGVLRTDENESGSMQRMVRRIAFSCGVTWSYWREATVQWHWPRWSFVDGDYYIMAPTVARILWAAPSRHGKGQVTEYGFGLVVAGVGVAVTWEKIAEQNAPNEKLCHERGENL